VGSIAYMWVWVSLVGALSTTGMQTKHREHPRLSFCLYVRLVDEVGE
jgi:hypothetical protein